MNENTRILNEAINELLTEDLGSITVVPAYRRDYKSKKAVEAAWKANKDFLIQDITSPHDGRYINLSDAKRAGISMVKVYYNNMRNATMIRVK